MSNFETLPDYLAPNLDIVLVGINPSAYSVQAGHYFANPRNRFWRAFNASGLAGQDLEPEEDYRVLDYGIGFTDVVKRPTPQASSLKAADFRQWCPVLREKLLEYRPRIACFHGLTGYKAFLKHTGLERDPPGLGLQPLTIGDTRLFVVPNPSPANAQYSLEDLIAWYRRLGKLRQELTSAAG